MSAKLTNRNEYSRIISKLINEIVVFEKFCYLVANVKRLRRGQAFNKHTVSWNKSLQINDIIRRGLFKICWP